MSTQTRFDDGRILGQNIWYYRMLRGMTQEQLAHASKTSAAYISKLELGVRNPTLKVLRKLATALEVSIQELLDRNLYFERARGLAWGINFTEYQHEIIRCPLAVQKALAVILNYLCH